MASYPLDSQVSVVLEKILIRELVDRHKGKSKDCIPVPAHSTLFVLELCDSLLSFLMSLQYTNLAWWLWNLRLCMWMCLEYGRHSTKVNSFLSQRGCDPGTLKEKLKERLNPAKLSRLNILSDVHWWNLYMLILSSGIWVTSQLPVLNSVH